MQAILQQFLTWLFSFLAISIVGAIVLRLLLRKAGKALAPVPAAKPDSTPAPSLTHMGALARPAVSFPTPVHFWERNELRELVQLVVYIGLPFGLVMWYCLTKRLSPGVFIGGGVLLLAGTIFTRQKPKGMQFTEAECLWSLQLWQWYSLYHRQSETERVALEKALVHLTASPWREEFNDENLPLSESRWGLCLGWLSGRKGDSLATLISDPAAPETIVWATACRTNLQEMKTQQMTRLTLWSRGPLYLCLVPALYLMLLSPLTLELIHHFQGRDVSLVPVSKQETDYESPQRTNDAPQRGCASCEKAKQAAKEATP